MKDEVRIMGKQITAHLLLATFLLRLLLEPEYVRYMFLRNVDWLSPDYMVLYPTEATAVRSQLKQIYPKLLSRYSVSGPKKIKHVMITESESPTPELKPGPL
jgi:hypothetical protein